MIPKLHLPARLGRTAILAGLVAAGGSGCSIYHPLPLPNRAELTSNVGDQTPWTMDAVAGRALRASPDLLAIRARYHVAEAQAYAAGLLPDPQASLSTDRPTDKVSSSDPRYPEYRAYGLSLSLDLQSFLLHGSTAKAASYARDQARLDLLWQEWQTVAQSRSLYVHGALAQQRLKLLDQAGSLLTRLQRSALATLQSRDINLEQASADLALLNDLQTQRGAAARELLQARSELHALLGLQPDAYLELGDPGTPTRPETGLLDRALLDRAIISLPQRRPDLAALRAGYDSQELQLRKAVLAQFPNISVSGSRARDTSNVHTSSLGVSLSIPLFDGGRGAIAVEKATRAQLRAEYLARLDQSVADGTRLDREIDALSSQLADLAGRLPDLDANQPRAEAAYLSGALAPSAYVAVFGTWLSAHTTQLDLTQALWDDTIAYATLLGTQVEPAQSQVRAHE